MRPAVDLIDLPLTFTQQSLLTEQSFIKDAARPGHRSFQAGHTSPIDRRLRGAPAAGYDSRVTPDRDERGRQRDDAANKRDFTAAIRDGLIDDESLSERERDSMQRARADREAAADDRRGGAADRAAAHEARDASERSGQ